MDDPFFRTFWKTPHYAARKRPATRATPVNNSPKAFAMQPEQGFLSAEPLKVVKIPVQYMDAVRKRSESESALRIQKVFLGFMVRKRVKEIVDVRNKIYEIEKRIMAALIRRDSRERLEVNEMLMSLLLRLDSVTGSDPGVKNCRKIAIRKVIALQEALDAIVAVDETTTEVDIIEHQIPIVEPECAVLATQTHQIDISEAQIEPSPEMEETGGKEEKRKEEILERMMEMLSELVQRNELQNQLLSSVLQRVEKLEKALVCDRMLRKKKKKKKKKPAPARSKEYPELG